MSETNLLKFNTPTLNSGFLEIKVQNNKGAKLDGLLLIELQLPLNLVDSRIRDAAELAGENEEIPNFASLSDVVTAAAGWTVWAFNLPKTAAIRAYNYPDPLTPEDSSVSAAIEPGAALTLRIPLAEKNPLVQVTIPYSYQYGGREVDPITGTIDLITVSSSACKSQVTFTTDKTSPTMLPAGAKVKISWSITGWVSAVIRGPMSGGHSELRLSTDSDSDYWIEKGSLEILAVGTAMYMLDAEVCGPEGQSNVQVVRTILIDIKKADKYSSLIVRPDTVLPNGEVDLNWAVWGVKKAIISVVNHRKLTLTLTEQDLSRNFHGAGIWRINARNKDEKITLKIVGDDQQKLTVNRDLTVSVWENWSKTGYTGKPVALAVAVPKMALLTTDGAWLSHVGRVDDGTGEKDETFRRFTTATDAPKAWLALTAFDKSFVVLQQTNGDGLRLARYKNDGTAQGPPVDLDDAVKPIVTTPGSFFDIAAFENRVYVVAQTPDGTRRRSFSVRFDPQAQARPEPWLDRLTRCRLLTFDGGLYAVNRATGQMTRFDLTAKGELDEPGKAASATHKGQSLIRNGLLVPVGSVLAVLHPDPFVVGLRSQALVGLTGGIETDLPKSSDSQVIETVPKVTTQDLVYNPQTDEWSPCGHGLKVKPGAVAAYRGGDSERLWVLQPDGELFSLTGAAEDLFAQDYIEKFPSAVLSLLINKKRQFKIKTAVPLVQMSETYRKAGLNDFSSTDPAEITSRPPREYPPEFTVELKYNEADPAPITLRFLAKRELRARADLDYMLEVTFSGPDLSSATSVFKRLVESRGNVSVDQVFGSKLEHATNSTIEVPRPKRFDETFNLVIVNASPHRLKQTGIFQEHPYILDDPVEFEIKQNYSGVSLTFESRADNPPGELRVTLDFTKPPGIEVRSGSQPQTTIMRLNPDDAKTMQVRLATMLKPGDAPLRLEGSKNSISATDRPLYVCQIGYLRQ